MPQTVDVVSAGSNVIAVDANLKNHLAVTGSDDDTYLTKLVLGVQAKAEARVNRAFTERTLKLTLDRPETPKGISTPYGQASFADQILVDMPFAHVDLPMGPVDSITSVIITDDDGDTTTLASTEYYLTGDRIVFKDSFPVRMRKFGGLAITYVTGYGVSGGPTLPDEVVLGMWKALRTIYDHREDFVVGTTVARLPETSHEYFDSVKETWNL